MGFKSGDWGGHTRTWILLFSNHTVALFQVCFGSLSCWKILSSSFISNFSKLSTNPSSKISQYCTASMIPWTSTSFPTPFHPIQPHTMRLFPPPCLTVGVVVLSESGSPFLFQVYTFPSDPILFIFVSSDHKTLFQSSTVQFWWYWANLKRCTMHLFKKWAFLLGYRPKIVFFEYISHCLRCDRRRYNIVDKVGGFNSIIIKLSSCDLTNNSLFITRRELRRSATRLFSLSTSTSWLILYMILFPTPVLAWIARWE